MNQNFEKNTIARLARSARRCICLLALSATCAGGIAAEGFDWHDPVATGRAQGAHFIEGQGWNEDGGNYFRLPRRAERTVRKAVWDLSRSSAGLTVRFVTDAPRIRVRYVVSGPAAMPHMPATGVSGVDLYRCKDGGGYDRCIGSYSFGDTVRYDFAPDAPAGGKPAAYVLYLPLYNKVQSLQIGTPEGARFSFTPASEERPLVVYGTSIVQGACASRPGMAWTSCVARELDIPVVNLGFSGNGQLEKSVLDLMCELPARAYVLDCMANMNSRTAEEVARLVVDAVHRLRRSQDVPVLLVEQAGYSDAATHAARRQTCARHNEGLRQAYGSLLAEGVKDLYYLSREELDVPAEALVDYVHPSDWGMTLQARAVAGKLRAMTVPRR